MKASEFKLSETVLIHFNNWVSKTYPQIMNLWNDLPEFVHIQTFLDYCRSEHSIHGEVCNDVGRYVGYVDYNSGFLHETKFVCEEVIVRRTAMMKVIKKLDEMVYNRLKKEG